MVTATKVKTPKIIKVSKPKATKPTPEALEVISMERADKELKRIVDFHAPDFKLKGKVVITCQSRGQKLCVGWYKPDAWNVYNGTEVADEINISAETLDRPQLDIHATIRHELVHKYNHDKGLKDCSKEAHNGIFKASAEDVGQLQCNDKRDKKVGYGITTLSPMLEARILTEFTADPDAFTMARKFNEAEKARKKAPTKMLKWSCGCTNIRAVDVDTTCNRCKSVFIKA